MRFKEILGQKFGQYSEKNQHKQTCQTKDAAGTRKNGLSVNTSKMQKEYFWFLMLVDSISTTWNVFLICWVFIDIYVLRTKIQLELSRNISRVKIL